jgi:hypothetical protein
VQSASSKMIGIGTPITQSRMERMTFRLLLARSASNNRSLADRFPVQDGSVLAAE